MMVLQGCQENTVLNSIETRKDSSTQIRFTNYVGGMTRASRAIGDSFVAGDRMAVYGFQNIGTETSLLFNNQLVTTDGTEWTYTPLKYWEKSSKYDFYAVFPYDVEQSFDQDTRLFSISDFTVQNDAKDQTDIMIAHRITGYNPYNIVNFVFSHALSDVSFYLKTSSDFDTYGISKVLVSSFDVTGLYSKGSFEQEDWSSNVFTGAWTPDVESVYDMPEVTRKEYVINSTSPLTLAQDLLLLPQAFTANAKMNISFKLIYTDGTESSFSRTIALKTIKGIKTGGTAKEAIAKWNPNYKYNYTIAINPALTEYGGHYYPVANDDHSQDEFQDPDNEFEPVMNIIPVDTDGDGEPDTYKIDSDMDDIPDYDIIWTDLDGDGLLEGIPDRDGDGQPDDTDGDGNPDVIWYDSDGDGIVDKELEMDPDTNRLTDEIPQITNLIQFSALVDDWDQEFNATLNINAQ